METTTSTNASESTGLGDRMKSYEAQFVSRLDPKKPFAIRLDGHKFSSFTRPFKKPYDERIYNAMLGTAIDLMNEFNGATTVYTCSDEITMVYPAIVSDDTSNNNEKPSSSEPQLMFGGKIPKIISLTAAFATMSFNRHLAKQTFDPTTEAKLIEHIEKSKIYFDSRVFHVPENSELVNNLVWRCHYDCRRNSVSMLAQKHFSHKSLQGLNREQLLEKMLAENINWDEMPGPYKWGSFVKKEKYEIDATDEKGNPVKALRTRPSVRHFDMANCSDENINYVIAKYLTAPSN